MTFEWERHGKRPFSPSPFRFHAVFYAIEFGTGRVLNGVRHGRVSNGKELGNKGISTKYRFLEPWIPAFLVFPCLPAMQMSATGTLDLEVPMWSAVSESVPWNPGTMRGAFGFTWDFDGCSRYANPDNREGFAWMFLGNSSGQVLAPLQGKQSQEISPFTVEWKSFLEDVSPTI